MALGWLLTISVVLLLSPIVWVACINVVGLRRLSLRLGDCEDDLDLLRNKSRSLQTQVSKKNSSSGDEKSLDQKIDQEIASHVRRDGAETPQALYGRNAENE